MSSTDGTGTTPQVVVVAGSGRSGTSSIAGVLKLAGLRIPPPEVPGNRSNPRGFFEPRWVVDFHTRLLRRSGVVLTDARPTAFELTRAAGDSEDARASIGEWLREQIGHNPALVIKDPRNSWFLPMWRQGAADAGAEVSFLTMLRHPAEVVGSKDTYYKSRSAGGTARQAQTTRVASWLNVALFTEVMTRDTRRTFVLYNDLLDDWAAVVDRVGRELGVALLHDITDEATAEIEEFVDPGLRRVRTQWDEIDCPAEVQEMAQDVWEQLCVLAGSAGFDAEAEAHLDQVRARYNRLYLDAEALAQSSSEAAQRLGGQQARRKAQREQRKAARQQAEAGPAPTRTGAVRHQVRRLAAGAVRRVRGARGA